MTEKTIENKDRTVRSSSKSVFNPFKIIIEVEFKSLEQVSNAIEEFKESEITTEYSGIIYDVLTQLKSHLLR